ncbi:hypothetical protein I3842_02G195100 [Carya illinoinensis]|uniref:peroxidase n=1 Tax=Carya illinoinensis TaxID=32201 RepID=A0A922FTM8_CARIL|nr:hypothetical protein I3842_02G195100 [Carya illinoinensis]
MGSINAQISTNFYSSSCPKLFSTAKSTVQSAISKEALMGASILRLFFHDCFVNGCDGSILLDGTFKSSPSVVSCADTLAIAARDSVSVLGGPNWDVKLGRRDARTASQAAANNSVPPPNSNLNQLISRFNKLGLSIKDMGALSGAHTIGQARCTSFRARIYKETNKIDTSFAQKRRSNCPRTSGSGDNNLAPLDIQTPTKFDNNYYKNLIQNRGLLHSDQQLFNGGSTDSIIRTYSNSLSNFRSDFVAAMIKMGDIKPLTGSKGEIRKNCRRLN